MPKPDFSETERHIVSIFQKAKIDKADIVYKGEKYRINIVGKPTCGSGEPKTDVYILLFNEKHTQEIKISIKQSNADFLENKMSAESAQRLFGDNWAEIIKKSTLSIQHEFENRVLIYKRSSGRTEAGCITLGWKFELLNKSGGALSGEIQVDPIEVYKGLLLNDDKKNAIVEGQRISNSGIADYLLILDASTKLSTAENILDTMIEIDEYVKKHPKIYFACKALNYRTLHNPPKWDGDRPLSVYINWSVQNQKLGAEIKFDSPLAIKGNAVANQLKQCLSLIRVTNTCDLEQSNIVDSSKSN